MHWQVRTSLNTKNFFEHQSAYIDDGVEIGEGTKIWHFCHISTGARLGSNCTVGQNGFVGRDVVIGNNCKIQNNVSIYEGVTLEDEVFCGPSMVFTNVGMPRSAYPQNSRGFAKTLVKKGCTIGANATIVCGVVLGEQSFVGAGSVVTNDVPNYALVYGNPATIRGWMCQCGVKLEFHSPRTECGQCRRAYHKEAEDRIVRIDGEGQ